MENRMTTHPPAPPKKEGELMKYKNFWSGWKMRYFKLERSYLHYFETKHSMTPVGTITRSEIVAVRQCSGAFPDRAHVFEIVQKSGVTWQVQAHSPTDMVEWMRVLSPVPLMLDAAQYDMAAAPASAPPDDGCDWPGEKPPLEPDDTQPQFSVPYPELPRANEDGGTQYQAAYPQLPQDPSGLPSAPFFCSPPPPYSETDADQRH